ncbi:hypothetical protein HK414_27120 [Ramlibacter terrae]|uniref:Uncharacterized protein n=1 Tax=Ramlibacter terrae TaxID=2732511 RepID=A0ABX6P8A3_9BURK|nr:hypothetical protein HK414_27120 [Ramlibacter terrae]
MRAPQGDVDLGASTTISNYTAPVEITAKGSILGDANITTFGQSNGWISLEAKGETGPTSGSLSVGNISSNGSYSGAQGGAITLTAKRNISAGDLLSGYTPSYAAGLGGAITVESTVARRQRREPVLRLEQRQRHQHQGAAEPLGRRRLVGRQAGHVPRRLWRRDRHRVGPGRRDGG